MGCACPVAPWGWSYRTWPLIRDPPPSLFICTLCAGLHLHAWARRLIGVGRVYAELRTGLARWIHASVVGRSMARLRIHRT